MTAQTAKPRRSDVPSNRSVATSADVMVQQTNDDSVVSKRSAVAKQYFTDPYLRYFVRKPSRRAPLINRGYYLRMVVMTDVVVRCLRYLLKHKTSDATEVQVVSLGAGFDTLAFRVLLDDTAHALLAPHDKARTRFYDVDFPGVMQAKAACMRAAPAGTFPATWQLSPENATRPVMSAQYNAIGVDLRGVEGDVAAWVHALREAGVLQDRPTLLYAECVTQYLPPERSEALLRDIAHHFVHGVFVSYDQLHPQDSFGAVMQQSLRQRCSPLLGIATCGDGVAMQRRALQCGMRAVAFADFHALSRHYIAGVERRRVAALEPFDEAEEWAAMCDHYGITVAVTDVTLRGCCEALPSFHAPLSEADTSRTTETTTTTVTSRPAVTCDVPVTCRRWPSGRFGFEGWGNGSIVAEACAEDDVVLVSFGGFVAGRVHQRVNRVYCHSLRHGELTAVVQATSAARGGEAASDVGASTTVPALQFHSFTRLSPWCYVVFGGRTNPTQASGVSYCLRCDHDSRPHAAERGVTAHWTELRVTREATDGEGDDAPEPRYRHCAVALSTTELFVYGGCSGVSGAYLSDAWLATVDLTAGTIRWRPVRLTGSGGEDNADGNERPAAMVSAAMLRSPEAKVVDDTVWLCGGLCEEGHCDDALWQINVRTGRCVCLYRSSLLARFSHTLTPVCVDGEARQLVLLLGGSRCETSLTPTNGADAALLRVGEDGDVVDVRPLVLPIDCPTWTRHSCVPLGRGVVAVLGGGLTCFSFGTFVAKPHLLHIGTDTAPVLAAPALHVAELTDNVTDKGSESAMATYAYRALLSLPRPPVEEVGRYGAEAFVRVARQANRPVVFRATPLGPCVARWADPTYLQAAEAGTTVSVHVAHGSHLLDFVRKNFAFAHVPFEALVEHVVRATTTYRTTGAMLEEAWYYRSIAAHMKSERANVWKDFRGLGGDFVLPPGAQEYIMPRLHQACLRINAPPLQLWTHYDTFDNVLCQIVGRKRVVLFPPSEYNNLYMTGSSSAVMNLDAPDLLRYPRFIDACKTATEVILGPGDMLYFPAQWPHHITTLGDDSYSISVNVFFEHFATAEYDPKDLYGNKDLPSCVELRRQIVSQTTRLMQEARLSSAPETAVPPEYTEFALREAIQDLEQMAANMACARRAERNASSE